MLIRDGDRVRLDGFGWKLTGRGDGYIGSYEPIGLGHLINALGRVVRSRASSGGPDGVDVIFDHETEPRTIVCWDLRVLTIVDELAELAD